MSCADLHKGEKELLKVSSLKGTKEHEGSIHILTHLSILLQLDDL